MQRLSRALSAALLTLTLAACAGTSDDDPKADPSSTPSSAGPSAAPTGKPDLPQSLRQVTAAKSGVSFPVPKSWTIVDASAITDESRKTDLERVARGLNVTPEEFRSMARRVDLMAVAPDTRSNITVVPVTAFREPPSEETIRRQFRSLNATVLGVEEVDTPIGPARLARYSHRISGSTKVYGASLFVEFDGRVANVTVTSSASSGTRRIEDVVRWIRATGSDDDRV